MSREKKRLRNRPKPIPKPIIVPSSPWFTTVPAQMAALALLVLGAYWNSLGGGFHFDDEGIFLDSYIIGPGFGWGIFRLMQTRPLTFLTFHWNYLAGGASPEGFHWVNLLLHAGNAAVVLLIARRVLRAPGALLAAALFAIHPLQTEAVNYVYQRATLLAAFFALLSLLLFLRERYYWSVAAFGFSLLAKEETMALPVFLLLFDLVRKRHIRWGYYAAMLGMTALFVARLFYSLHRTPDPTIGFGMNRISAVSYALTQSRVVWIYLRLLLFPAGLNLDRDVALSRGLLSPASTLPALLLLALLLCGLAWMVWKKNQPALWALGFFVLLAPSSSVVPAADLSFEHRNYFPLLCLVIAAAFLLERLPGSFLVPTLVVLLGALFGGTIVRNRAWHDEKSLWADVVEKSPRKARGYFHLGQAYASEDSGRARQLYERGLELDPASSIGHTNLGILLLNQGDPQAALDHYRQALRLGGEKPLVRNNMGAAYLRQGQTDEGIQSFRRALELEPCRFDSRWNLMLTLSDLGKKNEALLASRVPANCRLLPEQTQKLEDARQSLR